MNGLLDRNVTYSIKGNIMGGTGKSKNKNREHPRKDDDKPKKSSPAPIEDDDAVTETMETP